MARRNRRPGMSGLAAWESQHREQAVRTAWRIVEDWVEAQLALVETQMVSTQGVFFAVHGSG